MFHETYFTMTLHRPLLLIQRQDGLYVEGYTEPEPNKNIIGTRDADDSPKKKWLSTKKAFKVKDKEEFRFLISLMSLAEMQSGIDISSLADRIEIQSDCCGRCNGHDDECDPNYFAILKPIVGTIKPVTNCPTCGCECDIETDAKGRHYYTPKNK